MTPKRTRVRPSPAPQIWNRAAAIALRLDPRRVLLVNAGIILALGVLGALHVVVEPRLGAFDLDGERNVSSVYAAGLWACVALVAALVGKAERGRAARVWLGLSVASFFVAIDEFGAIHERLERIAGVDWQVLYSPLALVAIALWVVVGRRLRQLGSGFELFVAGTVCGVASQAIEAVEYGEGDRRVSAFDELVVGEELLELTSAVLIGVALLAALRTVSRNARA